MQPTKRSKLMRQDATATAATDAEQELQRAVARADQYQDQFLRAKAEAENIRRRGQEDVAKAYKFAIESFAEALVPVADSLEKALQIEDAAPEAMREGVELTLQAADGRVCQRQSEGNRSGRTRSSTRIFIRRLQPSPLTVCLRIMSFQCCRKVGRLPIVCCGLLW